MNRKMQLQNLVNITKQIHFKKHFKESPFLAIMFNLLHFASYVVSETIKQAQHSTKFINELNNKTGGIVPNSNITNDDLVNLPECHKIINPDILEKITQSSNINLITPEIKLSKRFFKKLDLDRLKNIKRKSYDR